MKSDGHVGVNMLMRRNPTEERPGLSWQKARQHDFKPESHVLQRLKQMIRSIRDTVTKRKGVGEERWEGEGGG
ncbi:hypothetical protein EYF80_045765 [Liparis tanakae]|uniref:Uncharacterized protein n=1 Tax=Liparis tanakae TaxID=230148 RepID=A0A4Z2FSR8_9TELE|nr:hypothetical protein EYF80_045765 [Liparis tanakae]